MSTLDPAIPRNGFRARMAEFFYRPEVPYGLAIARIVLPIGLLFAMVVRWPHARELFSRDGAAIPIWTAYELPPMFPEPSGEAAVAIHTVLILALVTTCIGWCTRISVVLATAGYVYLNMLDAVGTMNKYSCIASHILFLLCFSHCGAVWSVDHWLKRARLSRLGLPPELAVPERFPAWPRRLIQIMIGVVYIGAAATKIHTPVYFTGEQMQTWMITQYNVPNLLGSRMVFYPAVLIVFAYVTIMWEILFIFLAWRGMLRLVMIGVGTIFHVMTLLTLGLWVFPIVCISAYFAFVNEADVEYVRGLLARWRERRTGVRAAISRLVQFRPGLPAPPLGPRWSNGIFAGVVVIAAVGGVGAEYKLDPYGIRRPEGPHSLKELDAEYVAKVTAPSTRIKNEDKVLTFDIGSTLVAGALLDRRTQFRQGEKVRAECGLVPPHEEMWVECNLHDSENRVVDTLGAFVAVDAMRMNFYYDLGDCILPGNYSLVLRLGGEEVMRRQITVLPRFKTLAN